MVEELILWYLANGRNLPWRNTSSPYYIWLSEIILQQTRVDQGISYYYRFLEHFPEISDLARASQDEVLKLWQGLGYYSRARNLHTTARYIHSELNGVFPETYSEISALKGVGPYTAAAISSFAFKLPHAVVDGNVSRVISRLFDIDLAINKTPGKQKIQEYADEILDRKRPDLHNQAIMELGAMICTPVNPKCHACPVQNNCLAYSNCTVSLRPVKVKAKKARMRYLDYAVLESSSNMIIRKRSEKDIWQGLHDFAALEGMEESEAIYVADHVRGLFPHIKLRPLPLGPEKEYVHQLTHQRIKARFWRFLYDGEIDANSLYLNVHKSDLDQLAVPKLVQRYLEDVSLI